MAHIYKSVFRLLYLWLFYNKILFIVFAIQKIYINLKEYVVFCGYIYCFIFGSFVINKRAVLGHCMPLKDACRDNLYYQNISPAYLLRNAQADLTSR